MILLNNPQKTLEFTIVAFDTVNDRAKNMLAKREWSLADIESFVAKQTAYLATWMPEVPIKLHRAMVVICLLNKNYSSVEEHAHLTRAYPYETEHGENIFHYLRVMLVIRQDLICPEREAIMASVTPLLA